MRLCLHSLPSHPMSSSILQQLSSRYTDSCPKIIYGGFHLPMDIISSCNPPTLASPKLYVICIVYVYGYEYANVFVCVFVYVSGSEMLNLFSHVSMNDALELFELISPPLRHSFLGHQCTIHPLPYPSLPLPSPTTS